jgi:hypothetical protein
MTAAQPKPVGQHAEPAAPELEKLPGFLFVAKDEDGCGRPKFCVDRAAVVEAVRENMFCPSDNLDADEIEQCEGVADSLIADGYYDFEGDPGFTLCRLHDGKDIIDQADRQAILLNRERERALGSLQAERAGLVSAAGHLGDLVDHHRELLRKAVAAMSSLHSAAKPDESSEDVDARIPAAVFRAFVDEHAALLHELAHGLAAAPDATPASDGNSK